MYSRKLALALAKQYRTCPPPDIRDDPSAKEDLERHLAICPYCSSQAIEDSKPWEELTERLQAILSSSCAVPGQDEVVVGQLRYVRSDMGRWRHGLFYNFFVPCLKRVLEYLLSLNHLPGPVPQS